MIASLEMISGDDTQISSLFHTWLTHEMIGLNFLNAMKRDMAFIWHSRVLPLKLVLLCKLSRLQHSSTKGPFSINQWEGGGGDELTLSATQIMITPLKFFVRNSNLP